MKKLVFIPVIAVLLFSTLFLVACGNGDDNDSRDGTYIFHSATSFRGETVENFAELSEVNWGAPTAGMVGDIAARILVVTNGSIVAYFGVERVDAHQSIFVGDMIVFDQTLTGVGGVGNSRVIIRFARM